MNTFMERHDETRLEAAEMRCPYNAINVCGASFSALAINSHNIEKYCGTENYDNCPLFLSKVLRRR